MSRLAPTQTVAAAAARRNAYRPLAGRLLGAFSVGVWALLLCGSGSAQGAPTTGEQAVIERLTRLEEAIRQLNQRLDDMQTLLRSEIAATNRRIDDTNTRIDDTNKRIDDTNKRIDDLWFLTITGFGVLIAGMFPLITLIVWDRRIALAPLRAQVEELGRREQRMEEAMREYAAAHSSELLQSMRKQGLL